jgi:hypothetical protein
MPIIFVMLLSAALAGMFAESPALRAETPLALTAIYQFANYWLRRLIAISAIWPAIMISVALIGGTQRIVLILTFVPIAVALYAAIAIPPAIWFAPATTNAVLGGIGKTATGIVSFLPREFRASVGIPQIPATKTLLWPVAAGLILNCLLGLFLYFVPITDDRELLFILLVVIIPLALLKIYNKAKGLQRLLAFAAVIIVLIFAFGGRGEAKKKALDKYTEVTAPAAAKFPGYREGGWVCASGEKDGFDLTTADLGGREFRQRSAEGCWTKMVLPSFSNHWGIYTAEPERPGDYMAVKCTDGHVSFPPQSPNANHPFDCSGRDAKERNTFFVQGNTELLFKAQ